KKRRRWPRSSSHENTLWTYRTPAWKWKLTCSYPSPGRWFVARWMLDTGCWMLANRPQRSLDTDRWSEVYARSRQPVANSQSLLFLFVDDLVIGLHDIVGGLRTVTRTWTRRAGSATCFATRRTRATSVCGLVLRVECLAGL